LLADALLLPDPVPVVVPALPFEAPLLETTPLFRQVPHAAFVMHASSPARSVWTVGDAAARTPVAHVASPAQACRFA
jgi:hypothetical protein